MTKKEFKQLCRDQIDVIKCIGLENTKVFFWENVGTAIAIHYKPKRMISGWIKTHRCSPSDQRAKDSLAKYRRYLEEVRQELNIN